MKNVKKFYQKLGVEGLGRFSDAEKTSGYVNFIKKFVSKDCPILDAACGYGRLTIPLAKDGFLIEGLDIVPEFIEHAKKMAKKEDVAVPFLVGDMRKLPYDDDSFCSIVCVWTAFNHLLTEEDQMATVKEFFRVLSIDGLAIIDMPNCDKSSQEFIQKSTHVQGNVFSMLFGKKETDLYVHNDQTLQSLMLRAGIKNYHIERVEIGGRVRLVLYLQKKEPAL